YCVSVHLHLHSFPTRRSSDLRHRATPRSGTAMAYAAVTTPSFAMLATMIALCTLCSCSARDPRSANVEWITDLDEAKQIAGRERSEEHTSELQSLTNLVCRLL